MIELDFTEQQLKPETIEKCQGCDALKNEIELLKQEIAFLKEKLNSNSNNSSKSPSTDFKKKKNNHKKSGRKPGAQLGHKGVSRKLVPIEQVDTVIRCLPPEKCTDCNVPLSVLKKIIRHQVYEIPLPRYEITEYQIMQGCCNCCQKTYRGETPAEVGRRGFGIRIHSAMALLTSKFKLSKRQGQELLKDFYQKPMCIGSVSNIEHRVSQSLEPLHQQIKNKIDESKVTHIDETGFKQKNRSGWAWMLTNELFSYLQLDYSRGKKVAKKLIGNFIGRIIVSDRYPAYDFLPENCHQVCWSHLKRDFQKISERSLIAGVIGRRLLHSYGKIFGFWKASLEQAKDDKRTRKKRRHLKNRLIKDLEFGASCSHLSTARTCRKILGVGKSLWLFMENPDIPATNNLAERQIRPLVIAKKFSFGVQSERGARFIERAYSVVLSCRQQNKNVFSWIQEAITQYFTSEPPPQFN